MKYLQKIEYMYYMRFICNTNINRGYAVSIAYLRQGSSLSPALQSGQLVWRQAATVPSVIANSVFPVLLEPWGPLHSTRPFSSKTGNLEKGKAGD